MSNATEIGLIGLHSEFSDKGSQLRVKSRLVGNSKTMMVDVTELGQTTSKKRALSAAVAAARLAGSTGKAVLISEHQLVRPANRLHPDSGALIVEKVSVRETTFAFGI